MAKKKIKLTRPELKRQRDALERFSRYLPMLKLKQQQLQMTIRQVDRERREVEAEARAAEEQFGRYRTILADVAGVNVEALAACAEVKTGTVNVAGVNIPVFEGVTFPEAAYSLFATPAWVDAALADLRAVNGINARLEIVRRRHDLLRRELTKIVQRVNLFEKVKIPEVREAIRVIRIHLGDEMTAGVARAKIAKSKLTEGASASENHGTHAGRAQEGAAP